MRQFRIKRIHVLAAGLAVAAAVVVIFLTMFIKPLKKDLQRLTKQIEDEQAVALQRAAKERALAEEQANQRTWDAQYGEIVKTRMPKIPYASDPIASMIYMWHFPAKEGALMDRWFRSTGAEVSGYSFPSWPTSAPDLTVSMLPPQTWNLSVIVKDLPDLYRWLKLIPKAPRFLQLNSVNLSGARSPGQPLSASVSVTLFMWVTGAEGSGAGVVAPPAAGGTAAAGGGARRGGGRGGGRRGGRGGGMMMGG